MRSLVVTLLATASLVACGSKKTGDDDGGDDDGMHPDACVGLECNIVDCASMQMPPTSISGTVFAPNGTLPLFGINVYVPREDPPAFTDGVSCDKCSAQLPGSPIVSAISDEAGNFKLDNVPAGDNIPLVITIGKWRRKITIPHVGQCSDNPLAAADTHLPRTKAEGDIPKIALTTGSADSMECLVRKLGIADSEITNSSGTGRIHYYKGNGVGKTVANFGGVGAQTFSDAKPFWSTVDGLKPYDIVFLSCEGQQNPGTKPQAALDAMKAYADMGGRVFASHWHNIWVGGNFETGGNANLAPAVWKDIATWTPNDSNPGNPILIDEVSNPKGPSFATWMQNVMGSTTRDQIQVSTETGGGTSGRRTATSLVGMKAERWVKTSAGEAPQMFQFTTPNEVASDQRCGKVVFTDMHVSGSTGSSADFPNNCIGGANNMTLTPQEKALAFMFFDIASCVGQIF